VSLLSDRNATSFRKTAAGLVNSDDAELQALRQQHDLWWRQFWGKSFVEFPNRRVLENWYGSLYALACSSRGDCPPPGLWYNFTQGMTARWDGDYTINYNYQAPFWAAYATDHFELADNYEPLLLDHLSRGYSIANNAWRISPTRQPDSLEKYIAQRAAVPPNPNPSSYKGIYLYSHLIPVPGWSNDYGTFWGQKSGALFCAVNIVQRWRLTHDPEYARKAYPFLKATAEFWDDYLVLKDGCYFALNDAVCENSGNNTNPATTISFLKLLYSNLIEISKRLNIDQDRVAKWQDILEKLSPFTYVPADSVPELNKLPPELLKGRMVIRDCEGDGPAFPKSAYLQYHDKKIRGSSAGMSAVQTIFPGWSFGLESPDKEHAAALNTVDFAAQWFDYNNNCNSYAAAAAIGVDPHLILANLTDLVSTYEDPDFTINTPGGGTENVAISTAALHNMFLQSYQENIHIFPNWPREMDAAFGDLPACGGFLISSRQVNGRVAYVKIVSNAGEICHLVNPWPESEVEKSGGDLLKGKILTIPTKPGETIILKKHETSPLTLNIKPMRKRV
jgi:hypothetical protein